MEGNRLVAPGVQRVQTIKTFVTEQRNDVNKRLDEIDDLIEQLKEERMSLRVALAQLKKIDLD